jgi:hypothetical protein
LREIFHQAGKALVEHGQVCLDGPEVVGVRIPPAPVDRDERNGLFHETASQEARLAEALDPKILAGEFIGLLG